MKVREYEKNNGEKGFEYKPEAGDEVVCEVEKVFERENLAVVDGSARKIMKYGIQVTDKKHGSIFMTITGGHAKRLKSMGDLKGKVLKFATYEHKEFGTQLGVSSS